MRTAARRYRDIAPKSIMKSSALFLHSLPSLFMVFFFSGALGEARASDKAAEINGAQRKAKLKTL